MADDDWTPEEDEKLQAMLKRARERKPRDQERDDLILANGLLSGGLTKEGDGPKRKRGDKHPGKRYYLDKSKSDKEAREAVGRLLRNRKPLNLTLRYKLAELFDGLPPYVSFDEMPMARRIVFENRRAGEPKETKLRDLHLASDFWSLMEQHVPRKKAVDSVCKKYGVGDTTVKEAIRKNLDLRPMWAVKKRIDRP
jgi:hypothetical protein